MVKALTTEQEALDEVVEKLKGVMGKRWMVAVWSVTNDEKGEPKTVEPMSRVTWKFPTGDFEKAVEQLKQTIGEEDGASEPPVPPPLKLADFGVEEEEEIITYKTEEEKKEPVILEEEAPPVEKERSDSELPKAMSIGRFMQEREGKSESEDESE